MINKTRELIKSKNSFVNLFENFLVELNVTGNLDMEAFIECIKGLNDLILIQQKNLQKEDYTKSKGKIKVILNMELGYIKSISSLVKDYRKNRGDIISCGYSLLKRYKEERALYA